MLQKTQNQVGVIRKFNRYYTNILGLLDQHICFQIFCVWTRAI